jgi:hypothetical protein
VLYGASFVRAAAGLESLISAPAVSSEGSGVPFPLLRIARRKSTRFRKAVAEVSDAAGAKFEIVLGDFALRPQGSVQLALNNCAAPSVYFDGSGGCALRRWA